MRRLPRLLFEVVGLQTPRGRLIFFALASLAIFVVPFHLLGQLSIWQRLGIPAPSIGLTRAYWHLLHLDPGAAWDRNPLIFAVLAVGLPLLAKDAYKLHKNRAR